MGRSRLTLITNRFNRLVINYCITSYKGLEKMDCACSRWRRGKLVGALEKMAAEELHEIVFAAQLDFAHAVDVISASSVVQ